MEKQGHFLQLPNINVTIGITHLRPSHIHSQRVIRQADGSKRQQTDQSKGIDLKGGRDQTIVGNGTLDNVTGLIPGS